MALPLPAETEAPASADDRVEAFAEFLDRQEEENSTEGISPEDEDASDMPDVPAREQRDEPDDPAIGPPVSWDNDAKALFEQLPPELQEKVAKKRNLASRVRWQEPGSRR